MKYECSECGAVFNTGIEHELHHDLAHHGTKGGEVSLSQKLEDLGHDVDLKANDFTYKAKGKLKSL